MKQSYPDSSDSGTPPGISAWTRTGSMPKFGPIWLKFQLVSKESALTVLTWTRGFDQYKDRNGRPGKRKGVEKPWDARKSRVSSTGRGHGISTRLSEEDAFAKALERATSKKRKGILARRMEQLRQAEVYGVRPKRTFRKAATKYLE